jgi:hypothetical protein
MTATRKLYRVSVTTDTEQDRDRGQGGTPVVLYCGYDRLEAARVYYELRAKDYNRGGYTGQERFTRCQSKEIAED